MKNNNMSLSDKLCANLKDKVDKGLKQKDIVEGTGLSKGYVSLIVKGERNAPVDTWERICDHLGVRVEEFVFESNLLANPELISELESEVQAVSQTIKNGTKTLKTKSMKQKKKLKIAQACHNAHNVLCEINGMQVIPWEEKSPEHQATVADSLDKILSGAIRNSEEAHFNFVMSKRGDGWEYGERYSTKNKTNPRLCSFDELEDVERQKEEMFFAVASSFRSTPQTDSED